MGVTAAPAWIGPLAKACVVLMIGGISFATFFSTLYVSRLKRMVEYLKESNRREWRRLGSPDTPLWWGVSRSNAGRIFRFVMLGPPAPDAALEGHRRRVRLAFVVFAAASAAVFLSMVALPLSAMVCASMR